MLNILAYAHKGIFSRRFKRVSINNWNFTDLTYLCMMFKNELKIFISVLLITLIAFTGCKSKYEKLPASNDTEKKYREAVKI